MEVQHRACAVTGRTGAKDYCGVGERARGGQALALSHTSGSVTGWIMPR